MFKYTSQFLFYEVQCDGFYGGQDPFGLEFCVCDGYGSVMSPHILYSKCTADRFNGLSMGNIYVHSTWTNPFLHSYVDICPLDKSLSVL